MPTSKFLNNIVLVGVGGTGMSAITGMLHELGYTNLIGIDARASQLTEKLTEQGINIIIGHGNYQIHPKDFVIYTDIEAVKKTPELQQSFAHQAANLKRYHKPYTYSEFLAEISKHFVTISITGTNGKSSTTGLMIHAASQSMPDFGIGIVGALMPDYDNNNYLINHTHSHDCKKLFDHIFEGTMPTMDLVKKYLLILEACEHKEHFLLYDTDYSIITNVGYDHQDYFPTQQSYREAFRKFIIKTKRTVVVSSDRLKEIPDNSKIKVAKPQSRLFDTVFGEHRSTNADNVMMLGQQLAQDGRSCDLSQATAAINAFEGLRRRMEQVAILSNGTVVYSDYGHHPDAIQKALTSLKKAYPDQQIIAIIEPHQAQRLLSLRDQFRESLSIADQCIVFPVYHAREDRDTIATLPKAKELHLENFADLGFALTMATGGLYMQTAGQIVKELSQYKDAICIYFSAGILDDQMRNILKAKE